MEIFFVDNDSFSTQNIYKISLLTLNILLLLWLAVCNSWFGCQPHFNIISCKCHNILYRGQFTVHIHHLLNQSLMHFILYSNICLLCVLTFKEHFSNWVYIYFVPKKSLVITVKWFGMWKVVCCRRGPIMGLIKLEGLFFRDCYIQTWSWL